MLLLESRTGEDKASLGASEVWHVGGGILLNDDCLVLGAHVALNVVPNPDSEVVS